MKPIYELGAWHETNQWVATVDAHHGGDDAALHAATQARSFDGMTAMAHDLIATLLEVEPDTFAVRVRYETEPPADFACKCPCAGCRYDCRLHMRGTNRRAKRTMLIMKYRIIEREPTDDNPRPYKMVRNGYLGTAPRKIPRLAKYYDGLAGDQAHDNPVPRPKIGGVRHTRIATRRKREGR